MRRILLLAMVLLSCGRDHDGDGFADDCDDDNSAVFPGALEACNGIDDDCDGVVDDAVGDVWYADTDGDTFGDPDASVQACEVPAGMVSDHTDCDDAIAEAHPGSLEVCDGYDNDCDASIDEGFSDQQQWVDGDGDGYGDDLAESVVFCDLMDGFAARAGDCDDSNAASHPGASDSCLTLDDEDCDGVSGDDEIVDEATEGAHFFCLDADEDGVGTPEGVWRCVPPHDGATWRLDDGCWDCFDNDPELPNSSDTCSDGIDDDCDGVIDDGC